MEIAGVVLGAIPLIFYALDNYQRALDPFTDVRHWKETILTISNQVELQRQQLRMTLSALDLELTSHTTMDEIECALQIKHPGNWETFMNSIRRMDTLMSELARDLYPDAQGPPNMTDAKSDRIAWEWRRVKRSFGSKRRKETFAQLQACNTALQNCGLEKREVHHDTENLIINLIRARFDEDRTKAIRDNVRTMHQAIMAGLRCTCPCPQHLGHIQLDWHDRRSVEPTAFSLAMSSKKPPQSSNANDQLSWRTLAVNIEICEANMQAPATVSPLPALLSPVISQTSVPPPETKSKGVKFRAMFRSGSKNTRPSSSPSATAQNTPSTLTPVQSCTPVLSRSPSPQPNTSLCDILQIPSNSPPTPTYIPVPNSQPSKQARIALLDQFGQPSPADTKRTIRLHALLSRVVDDTTHQRLALNRKQRFGIAAALSWAVLHLCDSPWLEEVLNDDAIHLFLEKDVGQSAPITRLSNHPYLSHSFTSTQQSPSSPASTNPFQNKQIQNITLYTLAIHLIELGVNKPLDKLRQEHNITLSNTKTAAPVDDYDIAKNQITELMLDAGMSYAHAVDRCLRFLFPGPMPMNTFEHKSFRSTFFADVVAPIQATYELIPGSISEIPIL